MAELNVLQCMAPSVRISQPQNLDLIVSTSIYVVAHACLNSNLHSGWGVSFLLDGGSGSGGTTYDDYEAPFEMTFINVSMSEHTIDAIIIDDTGQEVQGDSTHDQVTPVGVGDYYVAIGDSITRGSHDDIPTDDTSSDLRNTGGGYEPILNDLLTDAVDGKGYPHTVFNEGASGHGSVEGLALLPSILTKHPKAEYFLIQYGTNDAWAPTPSGLGLQLGNDGYAGSFKDNMQQIITLIKNDGRVPCLSKVPIALDPYSSLNTAIQEYNQVIDELVSDNNIVVVPPDFYTFFEVNQDQMADGLHPNGVGYQSMATIWRDVLTNQ